MDKFLDFVTSLSTAQIFMAVWILIAIVVIGWLWHQSKHAPLAPIWERDADDGVGFPNYYNDPIPPKR